MSYTIGIGELKKEKLDVAEFYSVEEQSNDQAPEDGRDSHTNERWPSYSGWSDFLKDTGARDLFNELMPTHPGHCLLTKKHLAALKALKKKTYTDLKGYNRNRLDWFIFWVEWALKNCKTPAVTNS